MRVTGMALRRLRRDGRHRHTVSVAMPQLDRRPIATTSSPSSTPTRARSSPDQSADRLGKRDASRTDRVETPLEASSLITHDHDLAWAAYADANGLDRDARTELVEQTDAAVRRVAGTGFVPTPFGRSDHLSDALGFAADGGIWVKDETGGVAGSQKARHLVTILLHLLAAERVGHLTEPTPPGDRVVRQRRARRGDARGRRRLADRRLRAHLDDRRLRRRNSIGSAPRSTAASVAPTTHRATPPCCASGTPSRPVRSRSPCRGPRTHWRSTAGARSGGRSASRPSARWIASSCRSVVERSPRASAPVSRTSPPTTRLHAVQTEGCAPLARAWNLAQHEIEAARSSGSARRPDAARSPLERADDGVGSTHGPLPMASSTTRPTTGSACSRR